MKETNRLPAAGNRTDIREKSLKKGKPPGQQRDGMAANLKRNWYFPISAVAFFCLNATVSAGYFAGLPFALAAALIVSARVPSMLACIRDSRPGLRAVSILTALGVCLGGQSSFYQTWRHVPQTQALGAGLPVPIDTAKAAGGFGAVVSIVFVYVCVLVFWKEMTRTASEHDLFGGMEKVERMIYSVILIASLGFVLVSFVQTDAFYGTEHMYDVIYTSDSPSLVKGNVYLSLTHPENDLRQPLFAVFAAPFMGPAYLAARLLGGSAAVEAILLDIVQVVMMFAANLLLADMMKLSPVKRICFMVLSSCTYTYLLFTLMMEQYIVAYFWLILCMNRIVRDGRPGRMAMWGAGGALLTSLILLPFMSGKSPLKDFRKWLGDMVKYGLEFVALMLAFCRFDIIFNLTAKVTFLSGFIDRGLTVADKFYQYSAFVRSCFAAPGAGAGTAVAGHISWQLYPVTEINWTGIAIVLLAVLSAVLNRDKKSSLLAAGWAVFSAVMLLGLGWGAMENGLILYALYFGWAFLVLLFQLAEKIEDTLHAAFLVPALSVGFSAVLAVINFRAIQEMVSFAIATFPV